MGSDRTRPGTGAWQDSSGPSDLRRLAARRRVVGDRMRRLVPKVVVASTTLVGTGALASWVAAQPGINASPGHPAPKSGVAAPPSGDPASSLRDQLQADEAAIRSLEAAMPQPGAGTPVASPGGAGNEAVAVPAVAPVPQITVPTIPLVAPQAPAVNAITGASRAVP